MTTVDNQGRKDDQEKIRLELVPPDALLEIGKVLTFGAQKYAPRNWERGMSWSRILGAILRHTMAIMRGEDRDPETGLLHSAHLGCCAMFLISFQLRKIGEDDRNNLVSTAHKDPELAEAFASHLGKVKP